MRKTTWLGTIGIAAALVGAVHAPSRASGTIDVEGANVAAGNAPAMGTVRVEPLAPAATPPALPSLGALGAIGTQAGAVPAFPGGGSGGINFLALVSVILPGGTYDYASYDVAAGVTVTYEGPVTIRTTQHTAIEGAVVTQGADQDVTFRCAGEFRLGGPSGGGVYTAGAGSDITLDVDGGLVTPGESPAAADLRATDGAIEVIGRGGAGPYAVDLRSVTLNGTEVEVVSSSGVRSDWANWYGADGVQISAFGGDVEIAHADGEASSGTFVIEASGAVRLPLAMLRTRGGNDLRVSAFGGGALMSDGGYFQVYDGGSLRVRATGDVVFQDQFGAVVTDAPGVLEVTSFGGDVLLRPVAFSFSGSSLAHQGAGPVLVTAADGVDSDGVFASFGGDVTVRALGGDLVLRPYAEVNADGAADLGAAGVVRCGDLSAGATILGGSVRAFGAQVRMHGSSVTADAAALSLLADTALAAFGSLQGTTGASVACISGGLFVSNATITTASSTGDRSGDVSVVSYAGDAGSITARSATIRSGDNATASGDVSLLVHTPFAPKVTAFLLPTSVSVKLGEGRGAGCKASGTFGFPRDWPAPDDGHVPFELAIGGRAVSGVLGSPDGRTFMNRAEGFLLKVTPPLAGSSEGRFSLKVDGDLTGQVQTDGELVLRLTVDGSDAVGSVVLAGGRFRLGRGEVVEPNLFPVAVAAKLRGSGRDTLTTTLGFAPGEEAPAAMPALTLGFGAFAATVAAEDFVPAGNGRFAARNPGSAPGLTSVTVDFVKGTVVVKGKNLDLGAFASEPSVLVPIVLGIGVADVRTLDVELSRKGAKLSY